MVEWDEINWRSAVGIILFALLVIAGSIFLINDYTTAKNLKAGLENDTARINDFYSTWKPPSQKDLEEMGSKAESLQKELNQLKPKIGLEVNMDDLQGKIRQLAGSVGVSLEKMDAKPETAEGFLKVEPITLAVKGANEQLSRFLMGIENLGVASRRQGTPSISAGQVEINLEFLSFDQQAWNSSYSCSLQVNPPELKDTDIGRAKVFKDDLAGLKEKVDAERTKLSDSKNVLAEKCELEKQISGLEKQINLSKGLAR